jgi:PqqD family protein of HPr-rel-A system
LLSNPDANISKNPSEHAATWRVPLGQALRYREWQGEFVLYNDLNGDTHLLGETAIQLLLTLQAAPSTEDDLAAGLRAGPECQRDEVDGDAVAALLNELQALALIEPVE